MGAFMRMMDKWRMYAVKTVHIDTVDSSSIERPLTGTEKRFYNKNLIPECVLIDKNFNGNVETLEKLLDAKISKEYTKIKQIRAELLQSADGKLKNKSKQQTPPVAMAAGASDVNSTVVASSVAEDDFGMF